MTEPAGGDRPLAMGPPRLDDTTITDEDHAEAQRIGLPTNWHTNELATWIVATYGPSNLTPAIYRREWNEAIRENLQ